MAPRKSSSSLSSYSFTLTLVRHGRTGDNDRGIVQGHIDTPLNEAGRKQALALAASGFPIADYELIYSSDLSRAYQTAQLLLDGHPSRATFKQTILMDSRLRERTIGILDGQHGDIFLAKYTAAGCTADEYTPPGGESVANVSARVLDFLQNRLLPEVVASGCRKVLLVSHGITLRQLVRHFASQGDVSFERQPTWRMIPVNTAVNHFQMHLNVEPTGNTGSPIHLKEVQLVKVHDVEHLDEEMKGRVVNLLKHVFEAEQPNLVMPVVSCR